jgi:hypothetical protein
MRLESGDTLLVLPCPAWKKQRTAWNPGHDADTTGAICGQLAGAFCGGSQIPEPLRSGLAGKKCKHCWGQGFEWVKGGGGRASPRRLDHLTARKGVG